MVQRSDYLGKLAKWREKQFVKVISGVRGCGKTTLLAMYIDWLKRSGVLDRQIIYTNMEDPESETILNYQGLYSYIKKRLCVDMLTYVFIDEIQKCVNYEKAIEGLLINKNVDLYVSFSSSFVFPSIPHIEIRVLPLSFAEHINFSKLRIPGRVEELRMFSIPVPGGVINIPQQKKHPSNIERRLPRQKAQMEKLIQHEVFNNYLSFGGFPFTAALGGEAGLIRQCVDGIYNTILVKDAAQQAGISDIPLLEQIAKLISNSTGRPLSSKKLSRVISAKGRKISTNTVDMYMRSLAAVFLFYHIERFDIKAGKHLKTLGKYYASDTGIRNMLLEQGAQDIGGQLENIVCLELLRRGFQVCLGKNGSDEINFVAFLPSSALYKNATQNHRGAMDAGGNENQKLAYFQVISSVRDNVVFTRKLSSLERIRDNHPKYILSLDETPFRSNYNGIIQRNLLDWLLDSKK